MSHYHTSVMLAEVLSLLEPQKGKVYIDATMGGGGHTRALLEAGARVIAIDQDQDAINHASSWALSEHDLAIVHNSFTKLEEIAHGLHLDSVDGILFDLGVSSHQLDTGDRGFSFNKPAPLDMRMDTSLAVTAADLLAALSVKELTKLFIEYGDERHASRIAQAIVKARRQKPLTITTDLAQLVEKVVRNQRKGIHPATKVFQALRIAVNDELHGLSTALDQAITLLSPGGILVCISFHSGEDRIVKHRFRVWQEQGQAAVMGNELYQPDLAETMQNQRSRSARLRAIKKL